jgi:hypothetical protein
VAGKLDSPRDEDTDLWQGSWILPETRTLTCGREAGFPQLRGHRPVAGELDSPGDEDCVELAKHLLSGC